MGSSSCDHGTNTSATGNPDKTSPNQTNLKGPGSGAFGETQADQKVGYSSEPAKKWYQANLGNDKGK
jgi:hypothetical protein